MMLGIFPAGAGLPQLFIVPRADGLVESSAATSAPEPGLAGGRERVEDGGLGSATGIRVGDSRAGGGQQQRRKSGAPKDGGEGKHHGHRAQQVAGREMERYWPNSGAGRAVTGAAHGARTRRAH